MGEKHRMDGGVQALALGETPGGSQANKRLFTYPGRKAGHKKKKDSKTPGNTRNGQIGTSAKMGKKTS